MIPGRAVKRETRPDRNFLPHGGPGSVAMETGPTFASGERRHHRSPPTNDPELDRIANLTGFPAWNRQYFPDCGAPTHIG